MSVTYTKLPIGGIRTAISSWGDVVQALKDMLHLMERDRNAGLIPPDANTPGQIYYQYGETEGTITRTWVKINKTWR